MNAIGYIIWKCCSVTVTAMYVCVSQWLQQPPRLLASNINKAIARIARAFLPHVIFSGIFRTCHSHTPKRFPGGALCRARNLDNRYQLFCYHARTPRLWSCGMTCRICIGTLPNCCSILICSHPAELFFLDKEESTAIIINIIRLR